MYINVAKFKTEKIQFDALIKKYDDSLRSLYYNFEQSSNYWVDGRAVYFYDDLYNEKKGVLQTLDNIFLLNDIYNCIIENYSSFGKKLKVNANSKNKVINSFDKLINDLNMLLEKYNNVKHNYDLPESSIIINQKQIIIKVKNNLENLKDKLLNFYIEIEEIENNIFSKINNILITDIKDNYRNYFSEKFQTSNISKAYINEESIKQTIETSNMYIKDESLYIFNFKEIFEQLAYFYVTNNSKELNSLNEKIIDNINTIFINSNNDINVFKKLLDSYKNIVAEYKDDLKEIANVKKDIL